MQAVGKLKRFKRVALRCKKTAENFGAIVAFACGLILVKSVHSTCKDSGKFTWPPAARDPRAQELWAEKRWMTSSMVDVIASLASSIEVGLSGSGQPFEYRCPLHSPLTNLPPKEG